MSIWWVDAGDGVGDAGGVEQHMGAGLLLWLLL